MVMDMVANGRGRVMGLDGVCFEQWFSEFKPNEQLAEMRFEGDANLPFETINMFLNETNLLTTTMKGTIEFYKTIAEAETGTLDRFYYWKERVNAFIGNLPENYPPEKVEWFKHDRRGQRLVAMIMTMERMNEGDIEWGDLFRGQEPYRFFDDCTIEQFKEVFEVKMTYEAERVWRHNHCEDSTDKGLWDTIQKTVSEAMDPEDPLTETYIYDPNNDADPLKAHFNAMGTCYFFLTVPTRQEIIGMQFSYIGFRDMINIRNERARKREREREEAARVQGRGRGRGRGQRGGPEAAGVLGRGRGRGHGRGQRGGPL